MSAATTFAAVAVLATVVAATSLQPANAENARQNATGACQAALPAYDGLIRKRPTAIRNEGTASAFVNCSMASVEGVVHPFAEVIVTNATADSATVTCTIVTGRINSDLRYYPVTLEVAAGTQGYLGQSFDNNVDTANLINASCLLPPDVELNYVHVN